MCVSNLLRKIMSHDIVIYLWKAPLTMYLNIQLYTFSFLLGDSIQLKH